MTAPITMDISNKINQVRARREATGLGLNVRFVREDGTHDEFSFASTERANAFRVKLRAQGLKVLN